MTHDQICQLSGPCEYQSDHSRVFCRACERACSCAEISIAKAQARESERAKWELEWGQATADLARKTQAIRDAWLVEGVHPGYHRQQKRDLLRDWPMLARAIQRLVEEDRT